MLQITKTKILEISLLSLGLAMGNAFFAVNITKAQTTNVTGCTLIPTCPVSPPLAITQNQAADITATINITGNVIVFDVPNEDPQNPPATISATGISSTATGIGNVISAKATDSTKLIYNSDQIITSSVNAYNEVVTLAPVPGVVSLISTANGNSTQGETCCGGSDFFAKQAASIGTIKAETKAITAPGLETLALNSSANANIVGFNGNNGLVNLVVDQNNAAKVDSITFSDVCCNDGAIIQNALGVGNASALTSASSTAYGWISQTNTGEISSSSETKVTSGTSISTTAQSLGNTSLIYNKWGYTQGSFSQYSNGDINSYAKVTPINYNVSAIVGATSQGNSAVLSTIGAEGLLSSYQEIGSLGTVSATAEFFGSTFGGVGSVVASSSGNGLVGFACSACTQPGILLNSDATQINGANTNATINLNSYGTGYVNSYGVAAGNSATFIAQNGKSVK